MMRALLAALLLAISLPAYADPLVSLNGANAPATGTELSVAPPKTMVQVALSYQGSGGELVIEGSTNGTDFTTAATIPLSDPDGRPQIVVAFGSSRNVGSSHSAPVAAAMPVKVRARLVALSGASNVTATLQ